jgi:GAF domain-containing protein
VLSADDLGLQDIDRLERKIPEVFKPLEDRTEAGSQHRALAALAPGLPEGERDRLATLLDALPPRPRPDDGPPLSVILYSGDDLFAHCASAACRHGGIPVFSTSEERDLDPVISQCLAKGGVPVLVLDAPAAAVERFAPEALAELRRRKRAQHPGLCTVQLADPGGPVLPASPFEGVTAVFARPVRDVPRAAFVDAVGAFLTSFPAHLRSHAHGQGAWILARVRDDLAAMRSVQDGSSVALALLRSVARSCERALTLVVRGRELLPERGIGFAAGPGREPRALPGAPLRLPAAASPVLAEALDHGTCSFVETADDGALRRLQARIGAPRRPVALLVPLRAAATTVSLTYADFGQREPAAVDLDLIETLAAQAGLALERILYRRRAER